MVSISKRLENKQETSKQIDFLCLVYHMDESYKLLLQPFNYDVDEDAIKSKASDGDSLAHDTIS